jgi:hypothetical protein
MNRLQQAVAVLVLAFGMLAATMAPITSVNFGPRALACSPYVVAYAPYKSAYNKVTAEAYRVHCGSSRYQELYLKEVTSGQSWYTYVTSSRDGYWSYTRTCSAISSSNAQRFRTVIYMNGATTKSAETYLAMNC